jgi:Cd2+/Zn2+-exporting ATPase
MNAAKPPLEFKIHGMDCAEEVAILKREVGAIVGGEDHLAFDILNGKMSVQPPASGVTPDAIVRAVARTGMRAAVWRDGEPTADKGGLWKCHGRTIATVVSGLLVLIGFVVHVVLAGGVWTAIGSEGLGVAHNVPWAARVSYLLAVLTALWYILPKAWKAARRLRPDMNLLMTVAVAGAIGIGEWFEAATVAFLFALSLALESWSVGRARRAVAALMELAPPIARLKKPDGTEEQVPPEQVPVGAHFVVKPGEKVPLDGSVVDGFSEVNQASITGESVPVPKQASDHVFAGTINGDGALEVECTKPANDTTLAHIIHLVADAQSRRAPSEQWVEKFARVYTPAVMALAFAFLVVPPLLFGGHWVDWFYRSLVLLVIACPCALVISTPVSIVAALAAAARNGVLIKGGSYMEAPARLQAIAIDKTGTLTEGRPRVLEVVPLSGHDGPPAVSMASNTGSALIATWKRGAERRTKTIGDWKPCRKADRRSWSWGTRTTSAD